MATKDRQLEADHPHDAAGKLEREPSWIVAVDFTDPSRPRPLFSETPTTPDSTKDSTNPRGLNLPRHRPRPSVGRS